MRPGIFQIDAAPAFIRSAELTSVETRIITLIVLFLALCVPSLLSPSAGVLVAEVSFPCIAVYLLLNKTADRFAPEVIFPAAYLLWYWLGNLPLLPDDRAAAASTGPGDRVWTFALLGLASYFFGTLLLRNRQEDDGVLRGIRFSWHESFYFLLVIVASVAIFAAWASIALTEGIAIFQDNVDVSRLDAAGNHHLPFQVMIGLGTLMLPINVLYLWTAERPRYKWALYILNAFILFVFLSNGSRGLVLPVVLTVFALRHYLCKRWRFVYILAAGLIIAPLLSLAGYYRSVQHFGPSYVAGLIQLGMPVKLQPFTNIYLYVRAPVETFRNVILVIPEVSPFQHGAVSVGFFEQLLPGRHPSSDLFFKDVLGHPSDGYGEPASILGSFYADFGVAGIIFGMMSTGLLAKFLYIRGFRASRGWLLAYCFLWQKLLASLYGSLFTYITEFFVPLIWILLVWLLTQEPRSTSAVFAQDEGRA